MVLQRVGRATSAAAAAGPVAAAPAIGEGASSEVSVSVFFKGRCERRRKGG